MVEDQQVGEPHGGAQVVEEVPRRVAQPPEERQGAARLRHAGGVTQEESGHPGGVRVRRSHPGGVTSPRRSQVTQEESESRGVTQEESECGGVRVRRIDRNFIYPSGKFWEFRSQSVEESECGGVWRLGFPIRSGVGRTSSSSCG